MSFYRFFIVAVVATSLTTAVFSGEDHKATKTQTQHASTSVAAQDKVNINKAAVEALLKVKGLNASKAKAIVAYRKKHGDFKSVEELKSVKGFKRMNEESMKEITDQFTMS